MKPNVRLAMACFKLVGTDPGRTEQNALGTDPGRTEQDALGTDPGRTEHHWLTAWQMKVGPFTCTLYSAALLRFLSQSGCCGWHSGCPGRGGILGGRNRGAPAKAGAATAVAAPVDASLVLVSGDPC